MFLQLVTLLGALGLFLYGLRKVINAIQKLVGDNLKSIISKMSDNVVKRICCGMTLSGVLQSSRASTVMIVSSVTAGVLTLSQATAAIMGANIGTTITAWIVTVFGFTIKPLYFAYPILLLGFAMTMLKKSEQKTIGDLIIGISFLFLGVMFMQQTIQALNAYPAFLSTLTSWASLGFGSVMIYLIVGLLLAFVLQSSSATIVITLCLLSKGWIPFSLAAAIVLGANIGTTINTNLAASKGNAEARRAALTHLVFNIAGVVIALILFNPFVRLTGWLISLTGCINPATTDFVAGSVVPDAALYGICLFHTLFNLFGTIILIWFTGLIVKLVEKIVGEQTEDKTNRLKYIIGGRMSTPAISIAQAMKEIVNFGDVCYEGFSFIRKALNETDPDKFEEYRMRLVEYEEITDKMEADIAKFLNSLPQAELNSNESGQVKILYRVISEMESLGDSGENVSRILERERLHNKKFDDDLIDKLNNMTDTLEKAYEVMLVNLNTAEKENLEDISNAYEAEDIINDTRDKLRDQGISQIEDERGNYQSVSYFLDIIAEEEAMGDFIINISQALAKKFNK